MGNKSNGGGAGIIELRLSCNGGERNTAMSNGFKTLLVGAGAEVSAPFNLPGGNQFTFDTCYFANDALYKALDSFYQGRLPQKGMDSKSPCRYQGVFLYSPKNLEFRKLAQAIIDDETFSPAMQKRLGGDLTTEMDENGKIVRTISDEGLGLLFDMLIKRSDDDRATTALREFALEKICSDAYFGTIESYFSSLINPKRRSQSFWRLVNYYWNAFFSVAEPLIRYVYRGDRLLRDKDVYQFTLDNLNEVVRAISSRGLFSHAEVEQTYYGKLCGCFDRVLTTNYTSLADALLPSDRAMSECTHLSGTLWSFESLESLTARDIRVEPVEGNEFVFPFLMTQVPIKPIVDAGQVRDYSKAIEILDETSQLVVLGYSFCDGDAHIAAMVQDYMLKPGKKMIFLNHSGGETAESIGRKLRLDSGRLDGISVMTTDDNSLSKLKNILRDE